MQAKRITLFVGHYGSGKTNLAVNFATHLHRQGKRVVLADMDIVNPYFRSKDSEAELEAIGIQTLSSPYANTNLDAPAMPASFYGIFEHRDRYAVLDVGGDDRGAVALGRYVPMIREENDFEMIFVANAYRALTPTPEDAFEVLREIEQACKLPVSAIANNSHLGEFTDAQTVLDSEAYIQKLCELAGLPLVMTAFTENLAPDLLGRVPHPFPITLQKKYY